MPKMPDLIEADDLLLLEPEEVGVLLLKVLQSRDHLRLHPYNETQAITLSYNPQASRSEIAEVVLEGWGWLEKEGFLTRDGGSAGEWYRLSRRGRRLATDDEALRDYRTAARLPRELLHPSIAERVWPDFLRGDLDSAVFKAYRAIEVAVREAGGYGAEDYGKDLMRKAFHADSGPLTDLEEPTGEREALGHLFAGAVQRFKNPTSHRHQDISVEEAVELLMFASHLMRIVDQRRSDEG